MAHLLALDIDLSGFYALLAADPVLADAVTHLAWPLADPASSTVPAVNQLERFRAIRDELTHRLDRLSVDTDGVTRRPDGSLTGDSG